MVENIGYPEYIMDNKLLDDQYKDVSFIICSNCQHDFIIRYKGKKVLFWSQLWASTFSLFRMYCPYVLFFFTR